MEKLHVIQRIIKYNCFPQDSKVFPPTNLDNKQPRLLAVGPCKSSISNYHIWVDGKVVPIEAQTITDAVTTLFKSHFVFDTSYDENLSAFYNYFQYYVFELKTGTVKLTPTLRQVRAMIKQFE